MNCKKIVSFFSTAVMVLSPVSSGWGGTNFAPAAYAVDNPSACLLEPGIYIAPLCQCRTGFGLDSLLDNEYQHFNGRAKLEVTEDGKQIVTIGVENWDFYEAFVPMNQEYNNLFGDKNVGKNAETSKYVAFRDAFPEKLLNELVESGDENAKEFKESSTYCTSKVDDFFEYGDIKYGDITVETDTDHSSDSAYVSFEINDYREEFYVAAWANRPGNDGYEASRQFILNYADMYKADDLEKAIESNDVGFRLMLPSAAMKTATNNPVMYAANNTSSKIFDSVSTKVETDSNGNKKIIATYHVSDSYPKASDFEKLCSVNETEKNDSTAWSLYSRRNTESLVLSDDRCLTIEYKYNSVDDLIFGEYIYFMNGTNAFTKRSVYYTQPVLAPKIENYELADEKSGVKVSFKTSQVQSPDNISLNVESKPIDNTTKSIVEYGYANDSSNWYKIDLIDKSTGEAAKFVGGINVYIPMPDNLTSENRNNYISKLLTPYGELDGEPSFDYESRYWTDENEIYFDGTMYYFLMNLAENETEQIKELSDSIYSAEAFLFKSGPTVPTYSMSNGALVHKVYIVVENGVKKMYFNAQDISGRGYLGHIVCDDVSSHNSAYTDDIVYTKYLTYDQAGSDDSSLKGQLVGNSGYDPITEWACVTGGILTLVDDSFIISNINAPAYQVAIGAPPMAAMGNMLYSEVAVDDLVAQLQFFNVKEIAEATPENIQKYVIDEGYGFERSALLRQQLRSEENYENALADSLFGKEYSQYALDTADTAVENATKLLEKEAASSAEYEAAIESLMKADKKLVPMTDSALNGYDAVLKDNVKLNFYMDFTENEKSSGSVKITLPSGKEETKPVSELDRDDKYGYIVSANVPAKEISGKVFVSVLDGEGNVGSTYSYSVKDFAEKRLASNDISDKEKNLINAMLNYGSYAQKYFDYNIDNLANEPTELADVSLEDIYVTSVEDADENVDFVGAALSLKNRTAIQVYFNEDADFAVDGKNVEAVKTDDGYCVQISDILPNEYDKSYTITANNVTVTYSPYSYIIAALNSTEVSSGRLSELQNLAKALYFYGVAAKDYAA